MIDEAKHLIEDMQSAAEHAWRYELPYRVESLLYGGAALIEKLSAELEQVTRERNLLRQYAPPVTPGMDIFSIVLDESTGLCTVIKTKVADIFYNSNGWFFTKEDHKGPAFPSRHIGRVIFLDEEAAQQKCMEINAIRRNTHG